jgi:hypothetical protein
MSFKAHACRGGECGKTVPRKIDKKKMKVYEDFDNKYREKAFFL